MAHGAWIGNDRVARIWLTFRMGDPHLDSEMWDGRVIG